MVTPTGSLNADLVWDEIKKELSSVDISNKYDGISLDVDVNGYRYVTSMTEDDDKIYKEKKMVPLRKVGEALDMKVAWDEEKKQPSLIYKSLSGTFIKQSDFNYILSGGKTYVDKSYFEGILGYELYVIENKMYRK